MAEVERMKSSKREDVRLVMKSEQDTDLVAAIKRTVDGQALPRQSKDEFSIDSLLNKPLSISAPKNSKSKFKSKTTNSSQNSRSNTDISDRVGKFDLIDELARAPIGMSFGQPARGDADEASYILRRCIHYRKVRALLAKEAKEEQKRVIEIV